MITYQPRSGARPIQIDGSRRPPGIVSWNSNRYERQVRDVLSSIFSNSNVAGRAFAFEITRNTTIYPYQGTGCNAFAQPLDWAAATPRGVPASYCGDDPSTPVDDTGQPLNPVITGNGNGSDIIVQFTPNMWDFGSRCTGGPGSRGDEVLLHELVHGSRMMAGLLNCHAQNTVPGAVANYGNYHTFEEFVAVTVTNMYQQELHRQLRASHVGFSVARNRTTFYARYINHQAWIRRWMRQSPAFCRRLREQGPPAFNPFLDAS